MLRLLATVSIVPSSPILVTIHFSETSALITATRRNIQDDGIFLVEIEIFKFPLFQSWILPVLSVSGRHAMLRGFMPFFQLAIFALLLIFIHMCTRRRTYITRTLCLYWKMDVL
jgi:hypothetical protein